MIPYCVHPNSDRIWRRNFRCTRVLCHVFSGVLFLQPAIITHHISKWSHNFLFYVYIVITASFCSKWNKNVFLTMLNYRLDCIYKVCTIWHGHAMFYVNWLCCDLFDDFLWFTSSYVYIRISETVPVIYLLHSYVHLTHWGLKFVGDIFKRVFLWKLSNCDFT